MLSLLVVLATTSTVKPTAEKLSIEIQIQNYTTSPTVSAAINGLKASLNAKCEREKELLKIIFDLKFEIKVLNDFVMNHTHKSKKTEL